MTSSNKNIFRVTGPLCGEFTGPGEFPTQMPVARSFDVFFDLSLNKRLNKQPWGWWFETPSWSLWRHCNVNMNFHDFGIWLESKAWALGLHTSINTIWPQQHTKSQNKITSVSVVSEVIKSMIPMGFYCTWIVFKGYENRKWYICFNVFLVVKGKPYYRTNERVQFSWLNDKGDYEVIVTH